MADLGLISFGAFTVDTGTDELILVAHGVFDGNVIRVSSSGTLPTGLAAGTDYYVVGSTADPDRFQVSLTPGGTAEAISSAGSGTHTAYRIVAAFAGMIAPFQAQSLPWSLGFAYKGMSAQFHALNSQYALGFALLGNLIKVQNSQSPPWRIRTIETIESLYHAIGNRDDTEGTPNPPSIVIRGQGYFPLRWVIRPGVRSIQCKVKQPANQVPRPSIVIRANPSVGLDSDVEVFAEAGTDWVTVGPATFTATANGLVEVQLRGNYDGQMVPCWFDKCDGS